MIETSKVSNDEVERQQIVGVEALLEDSAIDHWHLKSLKFLKKANREEYFGNKNWGKLIFVGCMRGCK